MQNLIDNVALQEGFMDQISRGEYPAFYLDLVDAIDLGLSFIKFHPVLAIGTYMPEQVAFMNYWYTMRRMDLFHSGIGLPHLLAIFRDLGTVIIDILEDVQRRGIAQHINDLLQGRPVQNKRTGYQNSCVLFQHWDD